MSSKIEDRVRSVVAQVFGASPDDLSAASGPDDVEGWDSLGHIELIVAIEQEFDVALTPEQAMDALSVGLISAIVANELPGPADPPSEES